jgi:tetratricopeptide (TPR) repeat protein
VEGISEERRAMWGKKDEILNRSDELALKADLLAFEGRYTEADEYYSRALEINPGNPHLWVFKGITLSGGLHRDDEALKCWENAKKLDPELAKAISYTERKPVADESPPGPVTCGMSATTRQKILSLMREQADKDTD